MSELNYKAKNIAKAEREDDSNFFTTLQSLGAMPSISEVLFLMKAGGWTEDEASDFLDDKGVVETMQTIANALTTSGFLANSPGVQKAVAEAKASAEPSPNTGQTAKAQPTK